MRQERTADEKLLELLAREGRALERSEISRALGWNKQRAAQVLLRLLHDKKVVAIPGEPRPSEPGRPPALYALPQHAPAAAAPSAMQPKRIIFVPDTIVVTPLDREARVVAMKPGDYVEIDYLRVRLGEESRTVMHASLLRAYQAGRERPDPVRIGLAGLPDPATA